MHEPQLASPHASAQWHLPGVQRLILAWVVYGQPWYTQCQPRTGRLRLRAGVDPASRQALWAILLASKAQRALLLTTYAPLPLLCSQDDAARFLYITLAVSAESFIDTDRYYTVNMFWVRLLRRYIQMNATH